MLSPSPIIKTLEFCDKSLHEENRYTSNSVYLLLCTVYNSLLLQELINCNI